MLTGHGVYRSPYARFGKDNTDNCVYWCIGEDTVQYTIFECFYWATNLREHTAYWRKKLLLRPEENWRAVEDYEYHEK